MKANVVDRRGAYRKKLPWEELNHRGWEGRADIAESTCSDECCGEDAATGTRGRVRSPLPQKESARSQPASHKLVNGRCKSPPVRRPKNYSSRPGLRCRTRAPHRRESLIPYRLQERDRWPGCSLPATAQIGRPASSYRYCEAFVPLASWRLDGRILQRIRHAEVRQGRGPYHGLRYRSGACVRGSRHETRDHDIVTGLNRTTGADVRQLGIRKRIQIVRFHDAYPRPSCPSLAISRV